MLCFLFFCFRLKHVVILNCCILTICVLMAIFLPKIGTIIRYYYYFWHTHAHLTALCPGQPRWALTRKVKPIWILLKQETVIGSGISCLICKSAPYSRQITTQAYHHSVFDQLDAISAAQSTVSNTEGILTAYNAPVHPIDGAGRTMFSGCPVPWQAEALTTGLPLNSGCKFYCITKYIE